MLITGSNYHFYNIMSNDSTHALKAHMRQKARARCSFSTTKQALQEPAFLGATPGWLRCNLVS